MFAASSFAHPRLLLFGLDSGAPAFAADSGDSFVRLAAHLDEKPRRDHAGAAEPAAAMDQHAISRAYKRAQARRGLRPRSLESFSGNAAVVDREMMPFHETGVSFLANLVDAETTKLVVLHQGNDRGRVTSRDDV